MSRAGAGRLRLALRLEHFAFREPFRIAGHVFERTSVLVAELDDGTFRGTGEGAGVYYLGDDAAHMLAEAEAARPRVEEAGSRTALQSLMPPGGARNAIDCAFWDLEAQRSGTPAWRLAGLDRLGPLRTTMTIGADTPERMARVAGERFGTWPLLKLKLTGDAELDASRVRAVRERRPDAWIGVDANQGYAVTDLDALFPTLADAGVALLEQPVARGTENELEGRPRPLPFAADESVCTLAEVDRAVGRFDLVNIKLDKCGGLTEALAIAGRCRELGLGVMVGNMMGSSLSMAPSLVVGQLCDVVDLDGPTFLAADRAGGVEYRDGYIAMGTMAWGHLAERSSRPADCH